MTISKQEHEINRIRFEFDGDSLNLNYIKELLLSYDHYTYQYEGDDQRSAILMNNRIIHQVEKFGGTILEIKVCKGVSKKCNISNQARA